MPPRKVKTAAPTSGHVTTVMPRGPKRFAMPGKGKISAWQQPTEGVDGSPIYRAPYRDARPGFWGGKILGPWLSSANADINKFRDRGVANAREADRNQPFMNSGITKRAANTVGAQLRLQYLPNWSALGIDPDSAEAVQFVQDVENHFSLWGDDFRFLCDAQRQGQFGALMFLSSRECLGPDGETLVIGRYDEDRMVRYRGDYATFIEVVTCDRLTTPSTYGGFVPGRPQIVSGKELDEYGAAVAFHVETTHTDDITTGERKWERVPRETEWGRPIGIHFFPRHRAGQQRNMPAIIQSLRNVKMLDKFDDAELQAAVVNAILSIFIESPGTTEEILAKLTSMTPSGSGNELAGLMDRRFSYYEENAIIADGVRLPVLPPGDKISMETASRAQNDTQSFRSAFLRSMAVQLNLTYEQFSGDYSDTTFSSARAAIIDVWRLIMVDRILFTQHVAYPVFVGFMEELFVRADELGLTWPTTWPDFYDNMTAYTQCEFRGPGMGWVDPEKDVNAAGKRQEQALSSPTSEAALQGQDFRDNVDQIARDHAYARSKGVAVPGMVEYAALSAPPPPAGAPAPAGNASGADSSADPAGAQPPANEDQARAEELERQENRA